jgi:hypothetical protein
MSYPNLLYGPEGEQYNLYTGVAASGSGQRWPWGTKMQMQDGRAYRYARAGGTLLVIGNLLQSAANVANDVGRTAIAAALGSRAPTLTTGGAVTANNYAQGQFLVDVDPGKGQYIIDNHLAGTTATVYNLAAGHAIRVAALTTTSRVSLIANPYKGVIQYPAATPTSGAAGVAVSAIAATTGEGWIQTAGVAAVTTSGTLIIGNIAVSNIAAGAVGPGSSTSALLDELTVGSVVRVGPTTGLSPIKLMGID